MSAEACEPLCVLTDDATGWAASAVDEAVESPDVPSFETAEAVSDARHRVPIGVVYPPQWTVERSPTTVLNVSFDDSCRSVRVTRPHAFTDCLGAALSNYGRVSGLGWRIVSNPHAGHVRISAMPRAQLGGAGMAYADGRVIVASDAWPGDRDHLAWSLIAVLQHEIGHTLGHLGWPQKHGSGSCCMHPTNPMRARYPATDVGVALLGLAGFSRREADFLAQRFGGRWLLWVEQGLRT